VLNYLAGVLNIPLRNYTPKNPPARKISVQTGIALTLKASNMTSPGSGGPHTGQRDPGLQTAPGQNLRIDLSKNTGHSGGWISTFPSGIPTIRNHNVDSKNSSCGYVPPHKPAGPQNQRADRGI